MTQAPQAPSPTGATLAAGGSAQGAAKVEVAKEQAGQVGVAVKEAGGEVLSTAAEQAQQVLHEGTRQARDLLAEARGQFDEQIGDQKHKAVSGLQALAEELRGMVKSTGADGGLGAELASQAAERAHGLATWLDERDPGDVLSEVRRYAARKPGAFLLGAGMAGVLAGRLTRGVKAAADSPAPNHRATAQPRSSAPAPPARTSGESGTHRRDPAPSTPAGGPGPGHSSDAGGTGWQR